MIQIQNKRSQLTYQILEISFHKGNNFISILTLNIQAIWILQTNRQEVIKQKTFTTLGHNPSNAPANLQTPPPPPTLNDKQLFID